MHDGYIFRTPIDSLRTAVGSRLFRRAWIVAVALAGVAVSAAMLCFPNTRSEIKVRRGTNTLNDALKRSTGEATTLGAIQHCRDDALLLEYSTATVAENDPTTLLLAFEAADAAYRLSPTAASARNRAIAARRIGLMRLSTAPVAQSIEIFFQVEMVARATAFLGGASAEADARTPPGDQLFDDTFAALAKLQTVDDHRRAASAFAAFSRGRESFLANRPANAFAALAAAERDLNGLRIPATLMARDQRIRAQCWLASPACLDEIRKFRADLAVSGRYPWLTARAAYAEGQTYYRAGRIYEAAETFETAEIMFRRLNDFASVSMMHSLLGNAYAAAGETEIALTHYLATIQEQTPQVSDRRRKQLEDPLEFMLRHGYLSTATAILDELAAAPATPPRRVMEASLRGVLLVRRGDRRGAAREFDRAHALLSSVPDDTARAEVRRALVIAEAGSGIGAHSLISDLDAAVAVDQQEEISVWLPQLLAQRGAEFEANHDLQRALQDYLRAIAILERREPRIDQTMLSLGIAYDGESPFDLAMRLLLRQHRIADALSIAQHAATLRISSLYARGTGVANVFRNARRSSGENVVGEMMRELQPQQVVIAYYLLRDELITWIITGREIRVVRRGIRSDDVIALAEKLRRCAAESGCEDRDTLEVLSSLFVRDWIDGVARGATLLIQPLAETQGIPFSMLETAKGESLLARNAIATAPSLQAFLRAGANDAQRDSDSSAFFAAAPSPGGTLDPLPEARREVMLAARSYRGAVVDPEATRAQFLEQSPRFSIVHFAGHVLVNDQQPLRSALVFNDSQLLYLHELTAEAFGRARLVVLANCETGRAPRPTISVANAFLSQGVPSVVYTFWPVTDDASSAFAVAFHRAIAEGYTRSGAVRAASLALRRNHPRQPDIWAAFALAGTPGSLD